MIPDSRFARQMGQVKGDEELLRADIRGLSICFAAMSDSEYSHGLFVLVDLVEDSIIPDSNPPVTF